MIYWQGLQVRTLGVFEITFEGKPLYLNMKESSKPMQLLLCLLQAKDAGVSRRVLMESLFGQESETDAANNLNVTTSRLRRLLRESALPNQSYIRVRADRYFFQCDFPFWIDTQEVDQLRRTADLLSKEERMGLLYQLCDIYQGRFLPELDGETWVEIIRAHYQQIYRSSMEEICLALKQRQAFSELLRLTTIASKIFPFDEWQVWQQESLLALRRVGEAQELYRQVEELYLTEMDSPPPEHMRSCLQQNLEKWREADSVEVVREYLTHQVRTGGRVLPLSNFMNAYYLLQHVEGSSYCCVLCTLSGELQDLLQLQQAMKGLEEALTKELNPGDLFARYSMSQFVAILIGPAAHGAQEIGRKVEERFYKSKPNKQWKLRWQTI